MTRRARADEFNWNDLRFFLELARTHKLVVAAPRLGVDYTTVARRIAALESRVGSKLFARDKSGYRLTDAGSSLLKYAEEMEAIAASVDDRLTGIDHRVSGAVRIGATEGFGAHFLAPRLWLLHARNRALRIDLVAGPRLVSLSGHEADLAVTIERPARGRYVVSKLTDYALALYASVGYLKQSPPISEPADLKRHSLVGYIDELLYSDELRYLDALVSPDQRFALRSSSLVAQLQAVKHGAGVAILPRFMAVAEPELRPVLADEVEFVRTFWLVRREDNAHLSRIVAVARFLKEMVDERRELFTPRLSRAGKGVVTARDDRGA